MIEPVVVSQDKDPKAEPREASDAGVPASRSTRGTDGANGAGGASGAGGGSRRFPGNPMAPEPATRPGVSPQPATSIKGRATLAFDGGIPTSDLLRPEGDVERPAIVVPSTTATTPKAVTQPPPWTDGAARLGAPIPKDVSKGWPGRGKLASAEEISESMLLPDDPPRAGAQDDAEELSGSLLVEEATAHSPLRVSRDPRLSAPPAPSRPPPTPSQKPSRWSAGPSPAVPTQPRPKSMAPPVPSSGRAASVAPRPPPAAPGPEPTVVAQVSAQPVPQASAQPEASARAAGETAAAVPAQGFARDEEMDRSTKPHVGSIAPDVDRAPSGSTRAASPDDAPTSPVAVDTAPPTEDSLPRVLSTPEPIPAVVRPPPPWKPALAAVRATGLRALAWARAQRPAIDAALQARSRWFLPAVALAGLAIGIGLVAWIASATRHPSDAEAAAKEPASAPTAEASTGEPTSPSVVPPPAVDAPPAACTVAGERRVVAPKALVGAGVEVHAIGDSIAIGFAPNEHQGVVDRLDLDTLAMTASANAHSKASVRRVIPVASGKNGLAATVDADRPRDALGGRRTVSTDPPLQLGVIDGTLQWAKPNGPPAGKLWDLDGDGDVDALRAATDATAADKTMGIVFRRANAVNIGLASAQGAPSPQGALTHFAGAGSAIGSPTIALEDGIVFAAWADRATPDEPWRVRWVRFKTGENPGEPTTFAPPPGGPGEQTMSPAVMAVPGKRFLLVWTEGPQARHDVRALTFGEDGAPIGAPLVISGQGANAGQAQVAVTASGRGAIAFLESTDDGFQVAATPVTCASP
jgi:hypothetical protein